MVMPIGLTSNPFQEPAVSWDAAVSCLTRLTAQNGAAADIKSVSRRSDLNGKTILLSRLVEVAAEFGLHAESIELDWQKLKTTGFARPLLVLRKNGDVVVVTGGGRSGAEEVSVWDPDHDGVVFFVPREDFERTWNGHALIISPTDDGSALLDAGPGDKTASDADTDASPTLRPRRSLGQSLCFAAIALVAAASIGAFLLTFSDADHLAAIGTPARVTPTAAQGTPANREDAGAAAIIPAGPFPEAASTSVPAVPTESAAGQAPSDVPLIAPKKEANPVALPPEAAPLMPPAPGASAAEATPSVAAPVPSVTADRPLLSAPEIATLLARGDALLANGDLAAARLFYERAANVGDGQAAIRLGETFDPVFLNHAQLRGARGDVVTALSWYRRARELGAAQAEVLLQSLEGKQER
jgi:Peptidase C39 family